MNPQALPLRDIHLPDDVSWWPIAPGWWLLLAILAVVAIVIWARRELRTRSQLRKQALATLIDIHTNFHQHQDLSRLARECSVLLRRVALSRYERQDVAGLTGEDWVAFLNQQSDLPSFDAELSQTLTQAPFQAHCEFNADALLRACRQWLEQLPPQNTGVKA